MCRCYILWFWLFRGIDGLCLSYIMRRRLSLGSWRRLSVFRRPSRIPFRSRWFRFLFSAFTFISFSIDCFNYLFFKHWILRFLSHYFYWGLGIRLLFFKRSDVFLGDVLSSNNCLCFSLRLSILSCVGVLFIGCPSRNRWSAWLFVIYRFLFCNCSSLFNRTFSILLLSHSFYNMGNWFFFFVGLWGIPFRIDSCNHCFSVVSRLRLCSIRKTCRVGSPARGRVRPISFWFFFKSCCISCLLCRFFDKVIDVEDGFVWNVYLQFFFLLFDF